MRKSILLAFILLLAASIHAVAAEVPYENKDYKNQGIANPAEGAKADPKRDAIMNGIRFSDYEGFEKTFKLVTVTYRTDVKEMRFSYANEKAYETLLKDSTDYPDDAVFIKVAVQTQGDPAFLNSEVPAGSHRYQVMRRDREMYKSTDGWGYGSFAATDWGYDIYGWDGHLAPDNLYDVHEKCHACHTLVKDRGFIFSRIADTNPAPGEHVTSFGNRPRPTGVPGIEFETVARAALPKGLQPFVPTKHKQMRRIGGQLAQYGYTGNAYELRITFIAEAIRSKLPVVFYKENGGSVLLVAPTDKKAEPVSPTCKKDETLLVSYWTVGSNDNGWPTKDLFCYSERELPQISAGPTPDMH